MVPYNIKQVLVLRLKYPDGKGGFTKLRTGKLCSQASHGSMKVFFDRSNLRSSNKFIKIVGGLVNWVVSLVTGQKQVVMITFLTPEMAEWVSGTFAKVVLAVDTEEELLELYKQAQDAGLPCALIEDVGNTEFHGVVTRTVLSCGPAASEDLDKIFRGGTVKTRLA